MHCRGSLPPPKAGQQKKGERHGRKVLQRGRGQTRGQEDRRKSSPVQTRSYQKIGKKRMARRARSQRGIGPKEKERKMEITGQPNRTALPGEKGGKRGGGAVRPMRVDLTHRDTKKTWVGAHFQSRRLNKKTNGKFTLEGVLAEPYLEKV